MQVYLPPIKRRCFCPENEAGKEKYPAICPEIMGGRGEMKL